MIKSGRLPSHVSERRLAVLSSFCTWLSLPSTREVRHVRHARYRAFQVYG